jgi:hypothetical protein
MSNVSLKHDRAEVYGTEIRSRTSLRSAAVFDPG